MTTDQITFHVPDMSCAHCVKTIRQAIERAIEGTHVEADIARHLVTVTGVADVEAVAAIITAQDYRCEPFVV